MRPRLLALDVDGTLLDEEGRLPDSAREAIAAVRDRGIRVVLCTGRRFRTALPLARDLDLAGPVVVNNGVLVKEIESGRTLHDAYLGAELLAEVLRFVREAAPPLVYVDAFHEEIDFFTERPDEAHVFQREYMGDNTRYYRLVEDLGAAALENVIMVSTMADEARIQELLAAAHRTFAGRVMTHTLINKNYRGFILEFLSTAAGKWAALERIARDEGITPEEIVAVGDDTNDVDMIRGAGLGIAMGNAVPEARAAAREVVASNAREGAVEAIERFVLGERS